jgi:hypothetical protein
MVDNSQANQLNTSNVIGPKDASMTRIFLSASFPDPSRKAESGPYYSADIGAAASAVVEASLRVGADLVFGGHPTISPLVLHIASTLGLGERVKIFQSEYFSEQITSEVLRLSEVEGASLTFVPAGKDLDSSLKLLRRAMFGEPIDIAFFIGGMSGIIAEYELLAEAETVRVCFEAPGGAAAKIGAERSPSAEHLYLPGRAYASQALQALAQFNLGNPHNSDEL